MSTEMTQEQRTTEAHAKVARDMLKWAREILAHVTKPRPPGPPSYPTRHDVELLQRFELVVAHMSARPADPSPAAEETKARG